MTPRIAAEVSIASCPWAPQEWQQEVLRAPGEWQAHRALEGQARVERQEQPLGAPVELALRASLG